jgi:hypothetical protein
MADWTNIDISDEPELQNMNQHIIIKKKIIFLYDNESFENKRIRHKNIINLYRKYIQESHNISLLNNLIGLNILKNDIDSIITQENNLINIYEIVYKRNITKYELENVYLCRKCINIYNKYLNLLCEYRLPSCYKKYFTNNNNPYTLFMNNNSIKGYLNRLYWNEKNKIYKQFGLFNYKSNIQEENDINIHINI